MSNKESCEERDQSQRKDTTSLPNFDEKDKKEEKSSASSASSACSIRPVSSEKRKLKSGHTDILYCNIKRRQDLKRLNVNTEIPRKRPKTSSSSQGPVNLQEASYSSDNQIISQSPSSSRTKEDISTCKVNSIKSTFVRSMLDHGIQNLSSPETASDVGPKAEGQASEKKHPRSLAQGEKMKELKKESHNKFRDISEKCVLEKCKRIQFSQDSNSNKIIKEPLESRRKISFKIPVKSQGPRQKLVEENVFSLDSNKSKTKRKKKECLESSQVSLNLMRHKSKHAFSDSTYKQTVHERKGKYHHEQQESNDSSSSENLTQSCEVPCSSVSLESIQDTDQEMQIVEELHAARVGKRVGLPEVLPSGELTSMEIDLVEDDGHSCAANTASDKKLLIVIDTNILMNHLKFVRILKTTEIPGFDRLVLIIPWVVVQELDRMKAGKLLKYAQNKAVLAVHFINDSLKNQDRKLWGQSIQLASQKLYGLSDDNNDDRVLKCCLQYQELFPCSLIVLCTDDRNLRNKGLISGVKSLSKEELSAEFLNLSLNTDVCHQPCISKQRLKAEATPLEESYEEQSTSSALPILLESIISDLEKSLGTALSSILETEMKIAFGNLWMEMLYLKPPWTLVHLLQCFRKHWLAVFGLVMEKNLLSTIEHLYENLCKGNLWQLDEWIRFIELVTINGIIVDVPGYFNSALDFTTVKFLLQDSQSLLHAFSTRSNYDGILPQAFAQVNKLLQKLKEVKGKRNRNPSENTAGEKQEDTSPVKSDSQEITIFSGSHLAQPNRHQEIWSILENVWITIYQNSTDVFQRLGSTSSLSSSKIESFEEAFMYLQKLMAAVKDILEGIQRWWRTTLKLIQPHAQYPGLRLEDHYHSYRSHKHSLLDRPYKKNTSPQTVLEICDALVYSESLCFAHCCIQGPGIVCLAHIWILAPNSNYQDVETLYNFLIKYEVNKNVKFTAQELYDCVSQTEYREKLTIGCRQLVEMECSMQQCNASVYMEARSRGWCDDMAHYRA